MTDPAAPGRIEWDGSLLVVTIRGRLGPDDVLAIATAAARADPDDGSTGMLVDLRGASTGTLPIEQVHRIAVGSRLRFSRGPEYRYALVVGEGFMNEVGTTFLEVRRFLSGRNEDNLSAMVPFDEVDPARAWLAEVAEPLRSPPRPGSRTPS